MKAMRVLFAAALVGAAFALPACPITSIFDRTAHEVPFASVSWVDPQPGPIQDEVLSPSLEVTVDGRTQHAIEVKNTSTTPTLVLANVGGTENYNGGRVAIVDVRGADTRANGMISCAKGVAFTYESPSGSGTDEENWTAAKTAALQSNPDLAGAVQALYPELDKATDLVQVYCQAGWAAEQAAYVLTQAGYGNVVILGGWNSSTPPAGSSASYEFEDTGSKFTTCKDSNDDYVPNTTGEAWTAQSCSDTFEEVGAKRNGIKYFYNPNCGCTALLPAVGGNTAVDDPWMYDSSYRGNEGHNALIAQAVEVQTCPWNIGGATFPTGILLDVRGKRPTGDNPPIISCATTPGNEDLGHGFGVKWRQSPAKCLDDQGFAVSNQPNDGWTETACTAASGAFTAAVTTKGTVYIEKKGNLDYAAAANDADNKTFEERVKFNFPEIAKDERIYIMCTGTGRADQARLQLESNGYTNVVLLGGWHASNGYDSVFPGGIGNSPLRECGCQAPKAAPECVQEPAQEPKKPDESSSRRLMEQVKDGLLGSAVLAGMAAWL